MSLTVRVRDKKCYLVREEPEDSEPFLRRYWWPIQVRPEQIQDGGAAHHEASGALSVERSETGRLIAGSAFLLIPFDGKAQAEIIEREDIPAPKVRRGIVIRYRWGRWEKLTNKGWQ